MAVEVNELVAKLNFVQTSRFLKNKVIIEEHLPFPINRVEEQEQVQQIIYKFIKKRFLGCKIRANALTLSLRLDGEIHRKVKKVRDLIMNDAEWKRWFQDNHNTIHDQIARYQNPFQGANIEVRQREDKAFLYIPVTLNKIYHYPQEGLAYFLRFLEEAYTKETNIGNLYDRVLQLIEGERKRKEEERKIRIQKDKETYLKTIKANLFRHTGTIDRNSTTFEGKLALRMWDWCTENGIDPVIANEPTYQNVVPVGINVEILAPTDTDDEGWFAIPTFGGYEIPTERGYGVLDSYGEVTGHNTDNTRTRNGVAPIVVQKHLYLQFNVDHWSAHFPARYFEILEVTRRITEEVKAEVELFKEEQKAIELRETEARKVREAEAEKVKLEEQKLEAQKRKDTQAAEEAQHALDAQEEAHRVQTLRDNLQAQLAQAQQAEIAAEPDPHTFPSGIYRNQHAIPLEKYVVAISGGMIYRTASFANARTRATACGLEAEIRNVVRDYHNHDQVVETI